MDFSAIGGRDAQAGPRYRTILSPGGQRGAPLPRYSLQHQNVPLAVLTIATPGGEEVRCVCGQWFLWFWSVAQ